MLNHFCFILPHMRPREKCFYLKHAKTTAEMCRDERSKFSSCGRAIAMKFMTTFKDFINRAFIHITLKCIVKYLRQFSPARSLKFEAYEESIASTTVSLKPL